MISSRRHGETSAIVEVFTAGHGRHSGVVRGGGSRRMTPILQRGALLSLDWSARLEDHIGTFRVDPVRTHTAVIMADPAALAALGSICALLAVALPERAAYPALYAASLELVEALGRAPGWPGRYAAWELALLAQTGFGLDLERCAVTGTTDDLAYVSPKSGRAVSRTAGADWAPRLLPLPAFLRDWTDNAMPGRADLAAALRLTGFFLEARLAPSLPRAALPDARGRAVDLILRGVHGI